MSKMKFVLTIYNRGREPQKTLKAVLQMMCNYVQIKYCK